MIILKNISTDELVISDLGIILKPGESTSLDFFSEIQILESTELKEKFNLLQILLNDSSISYNDFISSFQKLTPSSHEELNTLQHNLSKNSYMESSKINGQTKFVTYYRDETKSLKEREEEIIRDENGKSIQIISRQYNDLGELISTEIQTLNRGTSGRVESITTIKS